MDTLTKNPNKLEILSACILGAILGAGLMALYILRTGGF